MGYLVCTNCRGYYKLQSSESPEDFSECQCGGKLVYKEHIHSKTDDDKLQSITSVAPFINEENQSDYKSKVFKIPKVLLVCFLAVVAILFKLGVIGLAIYYFMRLSNWDSSLAYSFVFFIIVFLYIIIRKYIFK